MAKIAKTASGRFLAPYGLALDGRVEMWRGSSRFGLSVAAPFVWRCPSNLAITPFPHPAHRTGRADLPHPALGQDTHAFAHERSCTEPLISSGSRVTHAVILTAVPSQPPMRPLGPTPASRIKVRVPSFTSASDAFRNSRALAEFIRVAPISSTSPLSASALN